MFVSSLCIFVASTSIINIIQAESTLRQVHVIFQHGDRCPDDTNLYPKDPYINDTWYPYGLGELTNVGKLDTYNIGKALRMRYDDFLGDMYLPEETEARSTSLSRAKVAVQLVLAGLWPPNAEQTIVPGLHWQPISFQYDEFVEDLLLGHPILSVCPAYVQEYTKLEESEEVQNYLAENKKKIDYINENSGLEIASVVELSMFYTGLYAEEQTNRTLPEWTKTVYPDFLKDAAIYSFELQTATRTLTAAVVGELMEKLSDQGHRMVKELKSSKSTKTSGIQKIFLYSGHEYNLACLLRALNSYTPHIPPYASYIMFELHESETGYGYKIYYQDTMQEAPQLLDIGCGSFCLLEDFDRLNEDLINGDVC